MLLKGGLNGDFFFFFLQQMGAVKRPWPLQDDRMKDGVLCVRGTFDLVKRLKQEPFRGNNRLFFS